MSLAELRKELRALRNEHCKPISKMKKADVAREIEFFKHTKSMKPMETKMEEKMEEVSEAPTMKKVRMAPTPPKMSAKKVMVVKSEETAPKAKGHKKPTKKQASESAKEMLELMKEMEDKMEPMEAPKKMRGRPRKMKEEMKEEMEMEEEEPVRRRRGRPRRS